MLALPQLLRALKLPSVSPVMAIEPTSVQLEPLSSQA